MQGDSVIAFAVRGPFAGRFLHLVFPETAVALRQDGLHPFRRLHLRDSDEVYIGTIASCVFTGGGATGLYFGKRHGRLHQLRITQDFGLK